MLDFLSHGIEVLGDAILDWRKPKARRRCLLALGSLFLATCSYLAVIGFALRGFWWLALESALATLIGLLATAIMFASALLEEMLTDAERASAGRKARVVALVIAAVALIPPPLLLLAIIAGVAYASWRTPPRP